MFRFEHPEYLCGLLLIPAFIALFFYIMYLKKRNLKRFGEMRLLRTLMPDSSVKRQHIKFWLQMVCLGLFVLMVSRPQFGSKLETVHRQGVEVMICLDVSNSMLSNDVEPSRLDKSKQILSKLIDNLQNDKIGLIVFAGDAFIQLPITSDYVSAKMFLSSINTSMVPTQGTAIGAAINLALRSFSPGESSEKTIILITDGENHEDDAQGSAKTAQEKGIKVHVLGVGSENGSPIPRGNDYMRDSEGNMITTRLNEQMCNEIAATGGGMYARTDNTNNALKALQKELNKMGKSEVENRVYSAYDEKFQIPGWLLVFFLVIEFFVLDRRNRVFSKIRLFR
ncbi:MAG: VWA domain-containing protein [Dysgonamonadaceae bacterium]|jgi:Ca-activated chloride channel family protein|nr:VWA domain-containing protein [Dysgonamonadaceae bacterium]